jgi:charged multivesicular body protein 2A
MMQAMKGATGVLGSMNRNMNLPALQRIAMEFEKENDIMDQRQEMMDDAIDDVTGLEDEAEGDEIVDQVLEEIGVDLKNAVSWTYLPLQNHTNSRIRWVKLPKGFRALRWQRARLHKLLEEVEAGTPETMTCKPGLTVSDDEVAYCGYHTGVFLDIENRSFYLMSI